MSAKKPSLRRAAARTETSPLFSVSPSAYALSPCGQYLASIVRPHCYLWRILHPFKVAVCTPKSTDNATNKTWELTTTPPHPSTASQIIWKRSFLDSLPKCVHFAVGDTTPTSLPLVEYVLIGRENGWVTAYNLLSQSEAYTVAVGTKEDAYSASTTDKGYTIETIVSSGMRRTFYIASHTDSIEVYTLETGAYVTTLLAPEAIDYLTMTPHLTYGLMVAASATSLYLWDIATHTIVYHLKANYTQPAFSIDCMQGVEGGTYLDRRDAALPNTLWLAAANGSQHVSLWSVTVDVSMPADAAIRPLLVLSSHRRIQQVQWVRITQRTLQDTPSHQLCVGALTDYASLLLWNFCVNETSATSSPPAAAYEWVSWSPMGDAGLVQKAEVLWAVARLPTLDSLHPTLLLVRQAPWKPLFTHLALPEAYLEQTCRLESGKTVQWTLFTAKGAKDSPETNDAQVSLPLPSMVQATGSVSPNTTPMVSQTKVQVQMASLTPKDTLMLSKKHTLPSNPLNLDTFKRMHTRGEDSTLGASHAFYSASASMASVLHQALQSADAQLLDSVLGQRDPLVIKRTIEGLSPVDTVQLLETIVQKIHAKGFRVYFLGQWLQELVKRRATLFMTHPTAKHSLCALYNHITGRLQLNQSCSRLQGRVDALIAQAALRKATTAIDRKEADSAVDQEPLIEYTEK